MSACHAPTTDTATTVVSHTPSIAGDIYAPVIVLVDDDPDILSILSRLFRVLAPYHALIAARGGETALGLLARCAVPLLITDYRLCGITGLQLIQATKQISPQTRTVLISAYDTPELRHHIGAGQVDDYLAKPVLIEPIRQIARATLG